MEGSESLSASPPSTPRVVSLVVRKEDDIQLTLDEKKFWKKEELEELLEDQLARREMIVALKSHREGDLETLEVERSHAVQKELNELYKKFGDVKGHLGKLMREKLPGRVDRPEFYMKMEQTDELEKAQAYLKVVNFFRATSSQIEANLESELETEAILLFHRLKRIELVYLNITECSNLQRYGKGIVAYWEKRLREKLMKDFEVLMESFGWPNKLKTATPTLEAHDKFHKTILNLSKLSCSINSSPDTTQVKGSPSTPTIPVTGDSSTETILTVKMLMVPLKRRFRYHFFGDKPTSESSRPEWYFAQIKTWLQELIPFVRTHLEPVTVSEIGVSSVMEFVRSVSEMLMVKIDSHLQENDDDTVFVRILEESIMYENEIEEFVAGDSLTTETFMPPFVNTIFSRPLILKRWVAVEKKACWEKLDDMFSSASAWNRPVIPGPPEIVDLFCAVIRCVTDRFAHLQQPGHKVQFLLLLVDLLDDFHVRCLHMWQSKTEFEDYLSKDVLIDYIIADTLHHITLTLQDWEDLPFFASLSFFMESVSRQEEHALQELASTSASEDELSAVLSNYGIGHKNAVPSPSKGLFFEICNKYTCLGTDILVKWGIKIVKKAAEEFQPYSRKKWHLVSDNSEPPSMLTEELLTPMQTLKDVAKVVENSMHPTLVDRWIKKLAVRVDEMLLEVVILPNRFSTAAINQLYFDITNGIFPIFSDSGINETLFFGSLCSALTILKLSSGEAMLLYDTLMNGNFEAHELALAELNICICQSEAIRILRARCDLHF